MHALLAVKAEPFEGIFHALHSRRLNNEADGALHRALWRMPDMCRQKKYFSFANRYVVNFSVVRDFQQHVTLYLMEPFLNGIVVKIYSRIRPADHHDDHVAFSMQQFVADRRLQVVLVFLYPLLKVERF